jgi:hypothetical protein
MFRHRQHCRSGGSVGDRSYRDQAVVSFEIGRVPRSQMPNVVRKHRGDDVAVMHLLAVNVELLDQAQAFVEYIYGLVEDLASSQPDFEGRERFPPASG